MTFPNAVKMDIPSLLFVCVECDINIITRGNLHIHAVVQSVSVKIFCGHSSVVISWQSLGLAALGVLTELQGNAIFAMGMFMV